MRNRLNVRREYKVTYLDMNSPEWNGIRVPRLMNADGLKDARQIKHKLKRQGYVDVNIVLYENICSIIR